MSPRLIDIRLAPMSGTLFTQKPLPYRQIAALLVSAGVTYFNAQSAGEAAKESLRFPTQWYVVSLGSGNVSVDLRSDPRPRDWY